MSIMGLSSQSSAGAGLKKAAGGDERRPVLLTDHPWPELDLEHRLFGAAGYSLVAGPETAGSAGQVRAMALEADPVAILTCWAPVSAEAIAASTHLAIVARLGVGLDNIAVQAATDLGVWVTNVPDYCVSEVSDHAIGLLLAHYRAIVRLDAAVKSHGWRPDSGGLERIADLTVGIVGLGRIGRETARKLAAFGCRVLAFSVPPPSPLDGIGIVDLEQILAQADVIILHVPLTPQTAGMIDRKFLNACKRQPLLINVSRGGLVDNEALLEALNAGALRGAALDVIDGEPSPPASIIRHPNVIVTPHIAFASRAAIVELRRRACEEVIRVLQGEAPLHPCNQPLLGAPLDGGVASDIRIVRKSDGVEIVKRALPKLKVAADWYSNPLRSGTEVAAIETAGELIGPRHVPRVLWSKPEIHTFAMQLVDPLLTNWKQQLLNGRTDLATGRRVGELLGQLHGRSQGRRDIQRRFEDLGFFHELRIEPFFQRVAALNADLAPKIQLVMEGMENRRSAFVHGDYSPKNILADGADVVILDYEVAHWGDPRFDVAFCMSHLILKSQRRTADAAAMQRVIREFLRGYRHHGPAICDPDLVRITGCLMLARLEGASPVDYLTDLPSQAVRARAQAMICNADPPDLLFEEFTASACQ